ncbi:hypothetical protein BDY24DRAFT_399565 [Mrakia frigida]|uniref:Whi2p n=1 Tax=Mrakia frigida TaxID=29902 RepID=UPI003FCBFBC8
MSSANPITSAAPPSNNPITSIQPQQYQQYHPQQQQQALLARLHLDVRGRRFVVEREKLMSLPESVLLCLFPNGLVLSRPHGGGGGEDEAEDVYVVDFDPTCFDFVLDFFDKATVAFYGPPDNPGGLYQLQQSLSQPNPDLPVLNTVQQQQQQQANENNPLLHKQGIIVLREELEYFVIPEKGGAARTDPEGLANEELMVLKREAGKGLLDRKQIFTALQRNVNKENNVAEQHLIDMLCMSGFNRDDKWGHRDIEPSRCSISSIALVLLKTGIVHPTKPGEVARVDQTQMATAQKLLLFWRKPARKCWWDGIEIEAPPSSEKKTIKVWARRVWTLELNLI